MQDKKQEAKSSAPKGPMKTFDLQRSILSNKNELFTKYHMTGKEADELAGNLKKYDRDLNPGDIRDLKKGLEDKIKANPHSSEGIKAANTLKFYQDKGAIQP